MIAFISMISRAFAIAFIRKINSLTTVCLVMQIPGKGEVPIISRQRVMQSLVRVSLHDGHRRQDYTSAIMSSLVRVSLHDGHRRQDYTSAIMLSASLVRVSLQMICRQRIMQCNSTEYW